MATGDMHPARPSAGKPKVSALAIVALVLAAIPCCPLTGLVGAFLGVIALGRIRRSGGGGRRIALAAVLVGAISAIISSAVLERLAQSMEDGYESGVRTQIARVLQAVDDSANAQSAIEAWAGPTSRKPKADAIQTFAEAARDRYGRFDRFAPVSMIQTGSPLSGTMEVAGVFHFAGADQLGSAQLRASGFSGWLKPEVRLIRLVIEDPEAGDLVIGGEND